MELFYLGVSSLTSTKVTTIDKKNSSTVINEQIRARFLTFRSFSASRVFRFVKYIIHRIIDATQKETASTKQILEIFKIVSSVK